MNTNTSYINWKPVPTGGLDSKGPATTLNVADGAGGWLATGITVNPTNVLIGGQGINNAGSGNPMTITSDLPTTIPSGVTFAENQAPPIVVTPSVLNSFVESAQVPCDWIDSFDGATVDASSSISFQKVGKLVTASIRPFFMTGTTLDATSYLTCSIMIPMNMIPDSPVNTDIPIAVSNNGVQSPTGVAHLVSTLQTINIWNAAALGGFGAAAQIALSGTTLMWHTS